MDKSANATMSIKTNSNKQTSEAFSAHAISECSSDTRIPPLSYAISLTEHHLDFEDPSPAFYRLLYAK
jgi:hypothetical protein